MLSCAGCSRGLDLAQVYHEELEIPSFSCSAINRFTGWTHIWKSCLSAVLRGFLYPHPQTEKKKCTEIWCARWGNTGNNFGSKAFGWTTFKWKFSLGISYRGVTYGQGHYYLYPCSSVENSYCDGLPLVHTRGCHVCTDQPAEKQLARQHFLFLWLQPAAWIWSSFNTFN